MPINKDFKRLVRRRMQKTGEAYTTARAHLLKRASGSATTRGVAEVHSVAVAAPPASPAPASPPTTTSAPDPRDYARIAGMSDAAVKAKTGCTWEKWVFALDYVNAHAWPHRAIAEYVHEKYQVPGWWAQMVTVGYERIRGLRDRGQRRGGDYEASKSRTVEAPVGKLFRAFSQPRLRSQWLSGVKLVVRKATPSRSIRITWEDGTSVEGWFTAKGRSKSQVQVQHRKLPSREAAERMKRYWTERLDALAGMLAPAAAGKS